MSTGKEQDFRQDINGLRAFAVLAVVLYHFDIPGFSGGFMGVDVFFTISGYLMTRIIVSGIEASTFSLSRFYLARARRIVPALLVLGAILLAAGWFLPLAAHEYRLLAKHVRDSVFFVSNLTYARESGYFDTAAHDKWLLHTWSLSVEWQFYLLWPLLLVAAKKLGAFASPRRLMLLCAAASLSWSIYLTALRPSDAFFALPSRAWELLAGGLVYAWFDQANWFRRHVSVLSMIGMAGLAISCLMLSPDVPWPGWPALFPVAASCLIIALRDTASPVWSNPGVRWLGLRSYSIYLWHWPFVVALGVYGVQHQPSHVAGALLATLLIGHFSFHYIELPFRRGLERMPDGRAAIVLGLALTLVALPAALLQGQKSLEARTLASAVAARLLDEARFGPPITAECVTGDRQDGCLVGSAPVGAILVGDSHAGVAVGSMLRAISASGSGIRFWGKGGCMTVAGIEAGNGAEREKCRAFNDALIRGVGELPVELPLVVVNRWSIYTSGLLPAETHLPDRPQARIPGLPSADRTAFLASFREAAIATACRFTQSGRRVYYVLPVPEFVVNVPNELARRMLRNPGSVDDVGLSLEQYRERNAFALETLELARQRCGIRLLDPAPLLCRDGTCFGSVGGLPLVTDNNHLNERGRRILAPMFAEVFRQPDGAFARR